MKRILFILFYANLFSPLHAQKESNPLKKHEINLLAFLLSDTVHNTSFVINNTFNWGLENELFTNSNVLKKGKEVFIQPLGTGRLYQAIKDKKEVKIIRIDKTIHSGTNFYTQNFFLKDTLYQVGGLGFWHIRGLITYFSPQTKQWELIQSNKAIQTYFDNQKDASLHFIENTKDPKLFVTNSYFYPNYPSSFETAATDSCYVYDFNTRTWSSMGKLTPAFKKIMDVKHTHDFELHINNLFIFQTQLEFYWVDFEANKIGLLNTNENNKLREVWLSTYNNDKRGLEVGFQFNLGNDIYFMKLNKDNDLTWNKTTVNLKEINTEKFSPIYTNQFSFIEFTSNFLKKYGIQLLSIALIASIFLFYYKANKKKRKMPKEVVTFLYQNFFQSITIVEKELIEILYQSNLKGEEVSTKTINKIIGVQQKDTLTQNKSRSDHFIKINQKFKMTTQNTEPLIIKNRDNADKRQYNYGLNALYLSEIEKLLKE
jgi:hypothetical protein